MDIRWLEYLNSWIRWFLDPFLLTKKIFLLGRRVGIVLLPRVNIIFRFLALMQPTKTRHKLLSFLVLKIIIIIWIRIKIIRLTSIFKVLLPFPEATLYLSNFTKELFLKNFYDSIKILNISTKNRETTRHEIILIHCGLEIRLKILMIISYVILVQNRSIWQVPKQLSRHNFFEREIFICTQQVQTRLQTVILKRTI